jgi:hypothetical protein
MGKASEDNQSVQMAVRMISVNKILSLLFMSVKSTYLFPITPSTCKKLRKVCAAFSLLTFSAYFCAHAERLDNGDN